MAAKKAAPAKPAADKSAKPITKAELYSKIAESTNLSKKQVSDVFDALTEAIKTQLTKRGGPEEFVLPGLLKLKIRKKPATKAKEGRNPFTGAPMQIKAKPASRVVKAFPLKALKELI
jgi:nucleoid DNA-binding protein